MASIYLSYRPGDNDAVAGRLYDQLVERFGRDAVIWREPGTASLTERGAIEVGLRDAVVVVALIGPRWLRGTGAPGAPLLDQPDDPVRLELEAALRRRLPIIPALTQGAALPQAPYLPPALRSLVALSPTLLRNDPDFRRDVERLVALLGHSVAPLSVTRGVRGLSVPAFALLGASALLVIALSTAGIVFATRAGVGPFGARVAATPTITPISSRTPGLVTVVNDPLADLVDYGGQPTAWETNVSGQCSFAGGGYQVLGSAKPQRISICSGPQITQASDERLSVTMRLTADNDSHAIYGLFFRSVDSVNSNGYQFGVTPSGRWVFIDVKAGQLLGDGTSSAIHTGSGAINTLTVDAYGTSITLTINGQRVGQITDSAYSSGQTGFIVEHGLVVVYSNFMLQRYQ